MIDRKSCFEALISVMSETTVLMTWVIRFRRRSAQELYKLEQIFHALYPYQAMKTLLLSAVHEAY